MNSIEEESKQRANRVRVQETNKKQQWSRAQRKAGGRGRR